MKKSKTNFLSNNHNNINNNSKDDNKELNIFRKKSKANHKPIIKKIKVKLKKY